MQTSSSAFKEAAGELQRIAESVPGERGRRASVVALVLGSVEAMAEEPAAVGFVRRRAEGEVGRLTASSERRALERILGGCGRGAAVMADSLEEYGAGLEAARRLEEAEAVVKLARTLAPERADLALRGARLCRLRGDRAGALELYATARRLDRGDGSIDRLAAVGEAVVADDAERALGVAIRESVRAGDAEAAAVGLEERSRLRRARGDRAGAGRDLVMAAARYRDAVDRGRVAHRLADLYVAAGDPHAARQALVFAQTSGDRTQRDHARARLHTVARDLGDEVGMRRWRSFARQSVVSLTSPARTTRAKSAAGDVARWQARVESLFRSTVA
jgi:tetratricopeptide (TPR) repeat protein